MADDLPKCGAKPKMRSKKKGLFIIKGGQPVFIKLVFTKKPV